MYKKKVLGDIRRTIGKVAKLDFNKDTGVQARFAGMTMYVNLEKVLISQVLVNGVLQWVEYEYLPTVCFSYRHYGHVKVLCPNEVKRLEDSEARGANGKEEHRTNLALNLVESTIDTSNYGPFQALKTLVKEEGVQGKGTGLRTDMGQMRAGPVVQSLTINDELPKEARTTPIPMDPEVEEKEGLRIDGHSRSTVMTENLREVWGLQGCGNENNLKVIRLSKPRLGLKICRKC
ncbi:hypothetical protein Gorai_013755 [Gossypium raimondii]|uniref:DUF4283 domain-containing protein n=1 Tax=Gossypium raimondii TaxID=29730 RepID=A0A7J8Q746_GOSRA|nr:hypothetical protein [Gossypium raimondii]